MGHPDEPAIVAAFLRQVLVDREQGRERGVADYQRLYAGHEVLIAAEYERLRRGEATPNASDDGPLGPIGDDGLIRGMVADR